VMQCTQTSLHAWLKGYEQCVGAFARSSLAACQTAYMAMICEMIWQGVCRTREILRRQ
jgi:hypothetical protein